MSNLFDCNTHDTHPRLSNSVMLSADFCHPDNIYFRCLDNFIECNRFIIHTYHSSSYLKTKGLLFNV